MIIIAGLSWSCKSARATTTGKLDESLNTRAVIRNHYRNEIDFKTLSARMRIAYTDGDSEQNFTLSLRMEKDKTIWVSAPLGVVKALITPERVTFYNKLQNEYFDGDFSYFGELLGTEVDFMRIQNLLFGQAMVDLREGRYSLGSGQEQYELVSQDDRDLIKTLFLIEPSYFRVGVQRLSQAREKRLLEVRYPAYQRIGNQVLPNEIGITAIENEKRTIIDLEYRQIELNEPLSFPYDIPNGFEEIELK